MSLCWIGMISGQIMRDVSLRRGNGAGFGQLLSTKYTVPCHSWHCWQETNDKCGDKKRERRLMSILSARCVGEMRPRPWQERHRGLGYLWPLGSCSNEQRRKLPDRSPVSSGNVLLSLGFSLYILVIFGVRDPWHVNLWICGCAEVCPSGRCN